MKLIPHAGVVLLDPFREMGAWWNFMETRQSGHALRSGPEVKNGRRVLKMARRRGSDARQSRRRLDPAKGVRLSAGAAIHVSHVVGFIVFRQYSSLLDYYCSGAALTKRLNERENEIEHDRKEKRKEAEELNMLRKRLADENHTDPDSVIANVSFWKFLSNI